MSLPAPGPEGPRLSVVISTLGNYETLRRVLDGYARQSAPPGSFEVVVALDAADPEPDTVAALLDDRPYPSRIVRGARPGLSANRNIGMRVAAAPLVLFTDNDTIPVRRLVAEHLEWHMRHPGPEVAVLGRVRWARELKVTPFMRWLDDGVQFDYANIKGVDAGWGRFAGANVSVKRSFALEVGDFDQDNFPYGYEDTDWAYRASKLGLRLVYNRRAVVDHLRPMTVEFWQKRARRVARAEYTFCQRHPEVEPWFHGKFVWTPMEPLWRGRAVAAARYVPRWVPVVGPRLWSRVDHTFRQALAPHFLAAWEEAQREGGGPAQPDLSEFDADSSAGRRSGGPK
jgi:GT2 family glycosyltransferase